MRFLLVLALVPLLIEGGVRASRVADVPLFVASPQIGYVQRPNQAGAVLWRNDWVFNEESMGVAQKFTGRGVLLAGDSVVCGGNPFRQSERLGPQLEKMIGRDVWPVCAGAWSLANALAYIRKHPEVETLDTLVFVINPADNALGSSWQGEAAQPTHRPASEAAYAVQRWLLRDFRPTRSEVAPWRPEMEALLKRYRGRVLFVLYPKKNNRDFSAFVGLAPTVRVTMRLDDYRDFTHPTVKGTTALASQIAAALR